MKVRVLELRRNLRKILAAVERSEIVVLSRRGRDIAAIVPTRETQEAVSIRNSPAFGMWKDRTDMADPVAYVGQIRNARFGER